MFGEDALAERLALHKLHGFNSTQPSSSKAEAADTAEGVNHAKCQRHAGPTRCTSHQALRPEW